MVRCTCSGTYEEKRGRKNVYYTCSSCGFNAYAKLYRDAEKNNTVITPKAKAPPPVRTPLNRHASAPQEKKGPHPKEELPMKQLPDGEDPPNSVVHATTIENAMKMLNGSDMVTLKGSTHIDFKEDFNELIWFGVPAALPANAPKNQYGSVEFYFDVTKGEFNNYKKKKMFLRKYGSEHSKTVVATKDAATEEHLLNVEYPPVAPADKGWLHPELCIEAPSLELSLEEVRVVFHRYVNFGKRGHKLNPGRSVQYRCVKEKRKEYSKGDDCADCALSCDKWLAQVFAFVNFAAEKGVNVKLPDGTQVMGGCNPHDLQDLETDSDGSTTGEASTEEEPAAVTHSGFQRKSAKASRSPR
eukprot:Rhum_TRINITY_DN7432_c0_g1::Rhum_TRINITY_DN7432_c0_g1_i1::g.22999::m.22999